MSNERRSQIITAARELLAINPRDTLAVRSVAERAGIGKSTLRHYFPTQQELREAVLASSFGSSLSDLRIADRSVPAGERLRECLEQLIPPMHAEAGTVDGWLDVLTATFGSTGSGEARLAWASHVLHARTRVTSWLTTLAEEGAVAGERAGFQAQYLLTFMDGLAISRILPVAHLEPHVEDALFQSAIDAVLLKHRD
ncbi:TetR/AcrR family transcriptional regulator [Arenivirga flava]|uniref:HTH tetR-type domain-containing protein n=1 Tax=Arenivirga flava TaxID=1930060 RepID=A0AA37UUN5_9MICO|nr:TetR/AcrR family transcriptional regulator [Arenivirga flava]GMA28867.1 hypothetical protein GCM10025874_21200 [Arenivirga flava]